MTDDSTAEKTLIEGLRHDAGDYAKIAQSIPRSHDLEWDAGNVRAWDAADLIESLGEQLSEANVNLSREMRARDDLQAKLDDTNRVLTEAQATISAVKQWLSSFGDPPRFPAERRDLRALTKVLSAPSSTGGASDE